MIWLFILKAEINFNNNYKNMNSHLTENLSCLSYNYQSLNDV
jgi:hypothetical protein